MRQTLTCTLAGISILAASLLIPTLPANAVTASAHHYGSCAAVHRVYSGGIAKPGVRYNKVHGVNRNLLKGNVKHSLALYNANRGLDRDHDGIACEKS